MEELKLTGMTHALERISSEAKRHEMTFEEILDLLLQAEVDHQRQIRMERRIKYSRLKQGASFEDFDHKTKRSITSRTGLDFVLGLFSCCLLPHPAAGVV